MNTKFGWALLAALAMAACGDGTLFSNTSSGANGTTASNASAGGSSSTSASGGANGSGGDVGVGGAGAGAGTGGDGMGGSGGEPPPLASLPCGDANCPVEDGSACCFDAFMQHGEPQAECVKGGISEDTCLTNQDASGYETRIECQTSKHCEAGLLCCGARFVFQTPNGQASVYEETSCQANCDFPDIVLCNTPGDTANCPTIQGQQGPIQTVCQQSQLLPQGYNVCGFP